MLMGCLVVAFFSNVILHGEEAYMSAVYSDYSHMLN